MSGADQHGEPTTADTDQRIRAAPEWRVGDRILDQYEIIGLRHGGMGITYQARHLDWGVDVALKRPQPHQSLIDNDQFVREARTWVGLGLHPHVCHCHYVRTIDGVPSIVSEYIATGCLADWINDGRLYQGDHREVLARILDIAIQTARGLEYAHTSDVLHRDVKPANILIADDHTVKICDFGIAGAYRPSGSMDAAYRGTRHYASPEQAAGDALRTSSDVWSFAVTVLEMLVGGVTWLAGPAAGHALTDARPAEAVGAVPPALLDLLTHCLAWEPDHRPEHIGDVLPALLDLFATVAGRTYPRRRPAPARPRADELNNRALSLLDLGRPDEARDAFDEALAADPRHLEASFNRGILRWRAGETTDDVLIEDLRSAQANGAEPGRARHLIELVERERGPSSPRFAVRVPPGLFGVTTALSPDSGLLVIGEDSGRIRLVDTAEGTERRTWAADADPVKQVLMDSKARHVVVSGLRTTASLWDLPSGRRLGRKGESRGFDGRICLAPDAGIAIEYFTEARRRPRVWRLDRLGPPHRLAVSGPTTAAAVTPDARWALFGDDLGNVAVWDLIGKQWRFTLQAHQRPIDAIAVDPQGRYAITTAGFEDLTARVLDLREGCLTAVLEGHRAPISSLAVSRDAATALTGDGSGAVRVWDLAAGTLLRALVGHTNVVVSTDLTATAIGTAVTADLDGVTRVWDLSSGRCRRTISGEPASKIQVRVSADGDFIVRSNRSTIEVWTLTAPSPAPLQPCRTRTAVELSDADALVHGLVQQALRSHEEGDTERALAALSDARRQPGHERAAEVMAAWHRLVPAAGPEAFRTAWVSREIPAEDADRLTALSAAPDGTRLLSAAGNAVRVHDRTSGELRTTLTGHTDTVLAVCVDPASRFAITGGLDGSVRVWDLRSGSRVRTLTGHGGSVLTLCTTPDGRLVAAAGSDGIVRVWNLETGALVHALEGHLGGVSAISVTPDGRDLLAADEASVRRWDLATGRCTSVPERFTTTGVEAIAVTADGMLLTFNFPRRADVRVRDLSTRRALGPLRHSAGSGRLRMAAIPGTAYAITADADAVQFWHPSEGRLLGRIDSPPGGVRAVCALPDGQHFATAGDDGAIRIWAIDWGIGDSQG